MRGKILVAKGKKLGPQFYKLTCEKKVFILVRILCQSLIIIMVKWFMKCFLYWTADLKSSKLWSSQLWMQFKQLRIEAWKSQDFNGVWTCDLAIPLRRSNQLSYEATDVGSRSFVNSNEPMKIGCEVIHEMFMLFACIPVKPRR